MEQNLTAENHLQEEFVCPVCLQLLLEPTTLTCGHNVCRGCLADWYFSSTPRRDICPVCRKKWMGHPHVNTTLKNVIERLVPQTLAERQNEKEQNPDYKQSLATFENELGRKRAGTPPGQEHRGFFTGIIVAVIAVAVLYFALSGNVSLMNSPKPLKSMPVELWTTADVVEWMNSLGWAHNYTANAQEHSVDGRMLLHEDIEHLNNILEVKEDSHQKAFEVAVQTLHAMGMKMPQNIWEYQELFPGHSLYLSYAMKDFPRFTMIFMYLFDYELSFLPFIHATVPKEWNTEMGEHIRLPVPTWSQWLMFWLMMLVFPYGMVGLFAWSLRSAHTVAHIAVIVTCFLQTVLELSFYSSCFLEGRWREWKIHVQKQAKGIIMIGLYTCFLPIIPSFICYSLFFSNIYFAPFSLGKTFYETILGRNV